MNCNCVEPSHKRGSKRCIWYKGTPRVHNAPLVVVEGMEHYRVVPLSLLKEIEKRLGEQDNICHLNIRKYPRDEAIKLLEYRLAYARSCKEWDLVSVEVTPDK